MMRKVVVCGVVAVVALAGMAGTAYAKPETIKLNEPDRGKGMPLMQALANRKSERNLAAGKLTVQQLSELLWAANGVNRPDGKRTAPAAMNIQAVDIYVVLEEGVYLWDPAKNELQGVAAGDHRKAAGGQPFVAVAAVNLVYVLDLDKYKASTGHAAKASREDKVKWAGVTVGAQAQNANLYCASEGLGAVVRGSVDAAAFGQAAGLRAEQVVILAQTIGVVAAKKVE